MSKDNAELTHFDVRRLAGLYDLEGYLFREVSRRFQEDQNLTPRDFFAIIVWKSNRAKTKVRAGLQAAGRSVQTLMQQIARAHSPTEKVRLLIEIDGIGIRVASAILAVCYPNQFTVLDYRAWATLCECGMEGLPATMPATPESYVQYCEACGRMSAKEGVSLRDLDRALWARSWEDDLKDLIEGIEA